MNYDSPCGKLLQDCNMKYLVDISISFFPLSSTAVFFDQIQSSINNHDHIWIHIIQVMKSLKNYYRLLRQCYRSVDGSFWRKIFLLISRRSSTFWRSQNEIDYKKEWIRSKSSINNKGLFPFENVFVVLKIIVCQTFVRKRFFTCFPIHSTPWKITNLVHFVRVLFWYLKIIQLYLD